MYIRTCDILLLVYYSVYPGGVFTLAHPDKEDKYVLQCGVCSNSLEIFTGTVTVITSSFLTGNSVLSRK